MYKTLQDFIQALDRAGELIRVTAPVSSFLEAAEIADRMSKAPAPGTGITGMAVDRDHAQLGGYALLFENITDAQSNIPLAMNLFGSYKRMEMALGCGTEQAAFESERGFAGIASRIAAFTNPQLSSRFSDIISLGKQFLPLLRIPPKVVRKGICQEVVKTGNLIDLFELPIIKCWPLDGDPAGVGFPLPVDQPDTTEGQGRFITLAGMYTIHADDAGKSKPASLNIGMYRAQLIDQRRLAMHWHMHHDGAAHWRSWKRKHELEKSNTEAPRMPVAIVLGGESVLPYAATAPLPPVISELLMAGFLNKAPIKLVKCKTVPLMVPANAEIIIEGWVSTEAGMVGFDPRIEHNNSDEHKQQRLGPGAVYEGPFGDHTGFYSLPDRYPIMEVTAITHRHHPVYPATIVGLPPQEDYYMGKATERIFLPLLQKLISDIIDYDLPMFGCFHNCAFIKIRKEYPLQARKVMHAIWGAGQMAWTKMIVVVDEEVDVHNLVEVLSVLFHECDFATDMEFANGPLDILDHAAPSLGAGSKIGFDATRSMPGESSAVVSYVQHQSNDNLVKVIREYKHVTAVEIPDFSRGRCAFIQVNKKNCKPDSEIVNHIINDVFSINASSLDFVIVVDERCEVNNLEQVLFHWCANTDPGRDIVRCKNRIGFDATGKKPGETVNGKKVRDFPPLVEMSEEIKDRVSKRWVEYGFADVVNLC